MKEEFNLSEKRKELFDEANKEADSVAERASIVSIFKFIHEQDKEFIRLLKEKPKRITYRKWIKKLAGEKLQ